MLVSLAKRPVGWGHYRVSYTGSKAENETARDANFGTGAYPTAPSATFNLITAVGDPRSWQLALRLRF